jgi:hypothetical protein
VFTHARLVGIGRWALALALFARAPSHERSRLTVMSHMTWHTGTLPAGPLGACTIGARPGNATTDAWLLRGSTSCSPSRLARKHDDVMGVMSSSDIPIAPTWPLSLTQASLLPRQPGADTGGPQRTNNRQHFSANSCEAMLLCSKRCASNGDLGSRCNETCAGLNRTNC